MSSDEEVRSTPDVSDVCPPALHRSNPAFECPLPGPGCCPSRMMMCAYCCYWLCANCANCQDNAATSCADGEPHRWFPMPTDDQRPGPFDGFTEICSATVLAAIITTYLQDRCQITVCHQRVLIQIFMCYHHTRASVKKANESCFPIWPEYLITSISQTFGTLTIPYVRFKSASVQVALTQSCWQFVCEGPWTDLRTTDAKTLRQLARQIDNWLGDSVIAVVWVNLDMSKADNFQSAEDIMENFTDAQFVLKHAVQIRCVQFAQDDTKPDLILVDTLLGHDLVWLQLKHIMKFARVEVQVERGCHSTHPSAAVAAAHSGTQRPRDYASELKEKFEEFRLGSLCSEICEKLGVHCIDDLAEVELKDVKRLELKPVHEKKLLHLLRREMLPRVVIARNRIP